MVIASGRRPPDLCPDIRNSVVSATLSLATPVTVEGVPAQGWHRDPSGAHGDRWFSAGRPTPLVRDHGVVSREDLPPDQQPGRRDPALPPARTGFLAEADYRPYGVVVVPCLVAFVACGLIVAASLVRQPTSGFELARTAVAWVQTERAVQVVACVAAAALLITAAQRPRWRRAIALTVWGVVSLQVGLFLLARTQYPGNSCWPEPGWAAITLSETSAGPTATVSPGAHIIATVPQWYTGETAIDASGGGILREECTVMLPGGGRRAIFAAVRPGRAYLGTLGPSGPTAQPDGPFMIPSWNGYVIVRGARN